MGGHIFVVRGDITLLAADAIAYSTDSSFDRSGEMFPSFAEHVPGFERAYANLGARERHADCAAGTSFWLDVPESSRPCGVVVTVSVGGEDGGALAVRGALAVALARLAARPTSADRPRRLVALPTFLTGIGGMDYERSRAATAQLRAARAAMRDTSGVDVAFVAYTEGTYQIFLEARRRLEASEGQAPLKPDPLLVSSLRNGECVLFIGAGISAGSGLPDWSGLIGELEERLGIESDRTPRDLDHYLDVAEWFRQADEVHGEEQLAELIHRRFSSRVTRARPTLAHYFLTSLPAQYVVTTNYDDLVERALDAQRRYPVKVVSEQDVALTGGRGGTYVVKLHGDAEASGRGGLVLGRDDYDDFFRKRPAMAALLEALLLNQNFFFVGYGLRDPDFRSIFSRISSMLAESRRPAFATAFRTSPHLVRQWARKRLHLIEVPGASPAEKEHALLLFLERLAESVTGDPQLFLAGDVHLQPSPTLADIRDGLLEVGRRVASACLESQSPDDSARLAAVLEFLVQHGWRPRPHEAPPEASLHGLFMKLAAQLGDRPELQRRLLVQALVATRSLEDATEVRRALAALGSKGEGDGEG